MVTSAAKHLNTLDPVGPMDTLETTSTNSQSSWWSYPVRTQFTNDLLGTATFTMLPWSTTGFQIILLIWLTGILGVSLREDGAAILLHLRRPHCMFPLLIFVLALAGTAWSEAPWLTALYTIKSTAKVIALPLIAYHFERSQRATWAPAAFFISCSLLMALSWMSYVEPSIRLEASKNAGVPVKNYIDQSQEFALCMIAAAPLAMELFKQGRIAIFGGLVTLIAAFFTNMIFVVSARTALIYIPAMLGVLALKFLTRRQSMTLLLAALTAAAALWTTPSFLRTRIADVSREYQLYLENVPRSTGQRLYYWQESLTFFAAAPIIGHGTGSTEILFSQKAQGKMGLEAEVTRNPHNQTLNMAVQWGVLGIAVLYATWICHLLLFRGRGFASWLGFLVVTQNIFSSLLNSHLFDFQEGWMYVLGVGLGAGVLTKEGRDGEVHVIATHPRTVADGR